MAKPNRRIVRRVVIPGVVAVLASVTLTMATSAAPSASDGAPATTAAAPAVCDGPIVNPDRTVTLCLTAPQAGQVSLEWQSMVDKAPTGIPYPMAKGDNGIWSITMGPLDPNWYGYAFTVDGVQLADPANRSVSFFQAPPVWPGPTSAWSWVMVPGAAADYMAETTGPHGTVATTYYYSRVLKSEQQMLVYTPPGYDAGRRDYPVLYLYSGGGGVDSDWTVNMRANFIMDNLINHGTARPMIVVMPEYNVRNCSDFTNDVFPQQLVDDVIPAAEQQFRVARGAQNRALAGLSSGAGCVLNTVFKQPGVFSYFGAFSPNWTTTAMNDLVQNHQNLLTNPAVNKDTKLLWLTKGGPDDIVTKQMPAYLALLDQYHITYSYVQGTTYGATYGHVWDTWRKALNNFAPRLFPR